VVFGSHVTDGVVGGGDVWVLAGMVVVAVGGD